MYFLWTKRGIFMRWEINFNPTISDDNLRELLPLFVEVEAFRKSVLKLPIPPGLSRKINKINIVRQIKGTTGIEGNTLTEEQINDVLDSPIKENAQNNEEQEVRNAYKIIEFIKGYTGDKIHISEDLIKQLHVLNTDGCIYDINVPGHYRKIQNIAGDYTPPAPEEVPLMMGDFIKLINSPMIIGKYGPLVRAIMAHFYLVTIHPFGDGNGRTSRALEAFILYHAGYNVRGFYSLANYYYKNRLRYIQELQIQI
jgi:Fic family protein